MVNVLLVDDMDFYLKYYANLVQKMLHWKVIGTAASGRESIEKTKELNPDVVFMDYMLPDISGAEATKEIKKYNPAIKVVAVTGAVNLEKVQKEMLNAGSDAFFAKPLRPIELKDAMDKLLEVGE